jgi:hypothetical protein
MRIDTNPNQQSSGRYERGPDWDGYLSAMGQSMPVTGVITSPYRQSKKWERGFAYSGRLVYLNRQRTRQEPPF